VKRIVAADIGGTHARFAIAEISAGEPVSLDQPVKFQTSDYASFQTAWEEFGRRKGYRTSARPRDCVRRAGRR
jgi:glucokinase